ncbi:MAG: transglutaminase domain-containing protein [Eubacteriales bacterium]
MFFKKRKSNKLNNPFLIDDKEELISELIEMYYDGNEHMRLYTAFQITPNEVISIFEDRRKFPFQPSVKCTVSSDQLNDTSSNISIIELDLAHSQGYRLFLSVIKPYRENLSSLDMQVFDKLNSIAQNTISSTNAPINRAKRIHDYLIDTSEYDFDNLINNSIPAVSYTPYGLIFNNKAVCQAYAETYMVLMTILGIECHIVIGRLLSSSQFSSDVHAWNIIKIDGKYGHVDVTSDNPCPKSLGKPSSKYFFVNDDYLDRTHSWAINQYPLCY